MSWNDADPADLDAALEAVLDDGIGVAAAAEGSQATAAEGSHATADAEAAAEGSQATAAADAEAAAEDAPNDAPSSATGDVEPAGEPHGGGEDGAQQQGAGEGADNCAICQVSLREDPEDPDPDDSLADSGLREVPLSILPCMHKFHTCCVDETCRVMNKSMSTLACPTCRKTPQDIRDIEERVISEGLARRVAEGLPHRAKAAQARQLQIDTMFGGAAAALAAAIPKAHGQRCAGLINL